MLAAVLHSSLQQELAPAVSQARNDRANQGNQNRLAVSFKFSIPYVADMTQSCQEGAGAGPFTVMPLLSSPCIRPGRLLMQSRHFNHSSVQFQDLGWEAHLACSPAGGDASISSVDRSEVLENSPRLGEGSPVAGSGGA